MKKQKIVCIALIVLIIFINIMVFFKNGGSLFNSSSVRKNNKCKYTERVFDKGDVLTTEQEDSLNKLIEKKQKEAKLDIIIVTSNEDVDDMMSYADNFYDNGNFGYNKIHGDGIILAHNIRNNKRWVSTCGVALESIYDTDDKLNSLFKKIKPVIEKSPYEGYKAFVNEVTSDSKSSNLTNKLSGLAISGGVAAVVTIIYAVINIRNRGDEIKADKSTYVKSGSFDMKNKQDLFIDKHVTSRKIEKNNGGGGGSHKSSGGVSHGGGGF